MFNALKFTQELEKAGFTREQAETSVKLVIEVMNDNFSTKSDLRELDLRLTWRLETFESRITARLDRFENDFLARLKETEYRLTIRLGVMMFLSVGAMTSIMRFLQTMP